MDKDGIGFVSREALMNTLQLSWDLRFPAEWIS